MIAKRKVKDLKIKREKLRREIASIRLQNWWRVKLAKMALHKRKFERRQKIKVVDSISSRWRGRTCKKAFQRQKKSSVLIASKIRQINAMKQRRLARRKVSHIPIRVRVLSAKLGDDDEDERVDVSMGSVMSVTPRKSAFRQSLNALSPMSGKKSGPNPRVYFSGFTSDMAKTTCSGKTGKKRNTNTPIFDETLPMGGDKFNGEVNERSER